MTTTVQANLTALAHATELATNVILKVAGDSVANTVNGVAMPTSDLKSAVVAQIQITLTQTTGVV